VLLLIQLFNVFLFFFRSSCCQEESVVFISPNSMNDCIIAGAERIFILLYCTIEKVESFPTHRQSTHISHHKDFIGTYVDNQV